jgi:DNA-directed RNA polymerase specialized sigma24 family protein
LLKAKLYPDLSPREIECVRLRAEGLRYEEIAGVLGLQSGTVGALLARAHKKIRQAAKDPGRKPGELSLRISTGNRYAS